MSPSPSSGDASDTKVEPLDPRDPTRSVPGRGDPGHEAAMALWPELVLGLEWSSWGSCHDSLGLPTEPSLSLMFSFGPVFASGLAALWASLEWALPSPSALRTLSARRVRWIRSPKSSAGSSASGASEWRLRSDRNELVDEAYDLRLLPYHVFCVSAVLGRSRGLLFNPG